MVEKVKSAGALVSALYEAVTHGKNQISAVPGLIKQVIREDAWREYSLPHSSMLHTYPSFQAFVEDWIGMTVSDLMAICKGRGDMEALDLIGQVTANPKHIHRGSADSNNVTIRGNASTYGLRKLRKDRPDLHSRVIKGELTTHAAMVEAGFRRKQVSVVLEPARMARAINRHFNRDERRQIIRLVESTQEELGRQSP